MRIGIHEPRPWQETLMYTLLRVLVGGLAILRAVGGMQPHGGFAVFLDPGFLSGLLAGFQPGSPPTDSVLQAAMLLLAGGLLLPGFWTRSAAVLGLVALGWALTSQAVASGAVPWQQWEGAILFSGVTLYLLGLGGGDFSLDHHLRERARLRAIVEDEMWAHPPYVSTDDPASDTRV